MKPNQDKKSILHIPTFLTNCYCNELFVYARTVA